MILFILHLRLRTMTELKDTQSLVDDLYTFRDEFFEVHPIEQAPDKPRLLKDKLEECLQAIERLNLGGNESGDTRGGNGKLTKAPNQEGKAYQLYLKGRALNVLTEHSPESETLLSRSVKLDPTLVDAWNELGECYWKRGDIETAKTCFEGALNHRENKISLRNLSIVLRQKSVSTQEEKLRNIETGLTRAREAVQLDTRDGTSWSILGNAYLAHFFSVSQNPRTLKQAMSAYKQAEKDSISKSSPELHYNKGVAMRYEEDYVSALECFSKAQALDPTWNEPKEKAAALVRFLTDVQHLVELKGKLKTKRFNSMVAAIDTDNSLGPIRKSTRYREVVFSDLVEGNNDGAVILGKVICSVHSSESVPFTFCLTDRNGQCLAVNLYNLAPGKGVIIGDSVAIAEPKLSHVKVTHKDQVISFDLIRVDSPLVLIINGKKAHSDMQAGIELSTFTKSN